MHSGGVFDEDSLATRRQQRMRPERRVPVHGGRAVNGVVLSGFAGAFPTSSPGSRSDKQVLQIGERGQRCPGFAGFHVRAGDLVQHPGRDRPFLSRRTQDTQQDTCGVPFPLQRLHFAANEGMPRMVNLEDPSEATEWPGLQRPAHTIGPYQGRSLGSEGQCQAFWYLLSKSYGNAWPSLHRNTAHGRAYRRSKKLTPDCLKPC